MFIAAAPLLKVMTKTRNQHQSSCIVSLIIPGSDGYLHEAPSLSVPVVSGGTMIGTNTSFFGLVWQTIRTYLVYS
jgi:hypothetical protein